MTLLCWFYYDWRRWIIINPLQNPPSCRVTFVVHWVLKSFNLLPIIASNTHIPAFCCSSFHDTEVNFNYIDLTDLNDFTASAFSLGESFRTQSEKNNRLRSVECDDFIKRWRPQSSPKVTYRSPSFSSMISGRTGSNFQTMNLKYTSNKFIISLGNYYRTDPCSVQF